MSAARDLREKILLVGAVGKAITETARGVKAEASAAVAAAAPQREGSDGARNDPQP
jgi:hypothetical protein